MSSLTIDLSVLDDLGDAPPGLELDPVLASPTVTHLRYKVRK